jgi:hypothetical protein
VQWLLGQVGDNIVLALALTRMRMRMVMLRAVVGSRGVLKVLQRGGRSPPPIDGIGNGSATASQRPHNGAPHVGMFAQRDARATDIKRVK